MGTTTTTSTSTEDHAACVVHQIVAGDTLAKIAKQFTDAGKEVTVLEICDFNGLSSCNLIYAGEFLVIPHKGSRCGCCLPSESLSAPLPLSLLLLSLFVVVITRFALP